jgi:hypothetical protein
VTRCRCPPLDRIPVGYISSYSLVLVVLIDSLTSAWVKRQKYWARLEDEFVKLKVDTSVSGMAVFKSTQGNYVISDNLVGIGRILLLTFTKVDRQGRANSSLTVR